MTDCPRSDLDYARWQRGESHFCLGCGQLPPHEGCSALCAACSPPNGTCRCAGCELLARDAAPAGAATLLAIYRVKRAVDGLNGRSWDAATHLAAEEALLAAGEKSTPYSYAEILNMRAQVVALAAPVSASGGVREEGTATPPVKGRE